VKCQALLACCAALLLAGCANTTVTKQADGWRVKSCRLLWKTEAVSVTVLPDGTTEVTVAKTQADAADFLGKAIGAGIKAAK